MNVGRVAGQKRVRDEGITVDLVLKARGNMQPDRADGLEDMTVAEMLKELPVDTMYEFTVV